MSLHPPDNTSTRRGAPADGCWTVIVPGLESLRKLPRTPGTPWLDRLLARADRVDAAAPGLHAAIAETVAGGEAGVTAWPPALVCGPEDGLGEPTPDLMRLDPVSLTPAGDRLVLGPPGPIDRTEAVGLAEAVAVALDGEPCPRVGAPGRWYARMAGLGEAAWTAPEDALGRDVFDRLPRGPGSGAVRRLLNEIQMVLHDHPVNRARVSRGLAPVNSVWPWGWATGAAVPPLRWRGCVYGDHPYARGLARLAGARAEPAGAPPPADTAPVLKVCDGPLDRLLAGDEAGAASALADFDAAWCQPLLQALRRGRIEALRILAGHRCYALRPAAAWRIWRRLPAAEGGA